ncbi:MAG: FG-GAP-like repeat-containing protein [Turneriella sp.]
MLTYFTQSKAQLSEELRDSLFHSSSGRMLLVALVLFLSHCKIVTPDSLLDVTPDSHELLKTMNVRNNGELWSGVVAGDLPAGVMGVDVKFDDGAWKKAEINGNRWRVFVPTGAEAAAGKQRWQVGSRHQVSLKALGNTGNSRKLIVVNFVRQTNKDINADGYADNIVGALNYNSSQGRAYIFYGSRSGIASQAATGASAILTGEASNNYFGAAVSLSDVNGDGYADAIVGAYRYNTYQGRVYVFHGSNVGIGSQSATAANSILTGEASNNGFGISIATADVNGDGYPEIVAGAYRYNTNQGRAYIFYCGASGIATQGAAGAGTILTGLFVSDEFGYSVAMGDSNGDGFADVVVAAYRDNGTFQGRAYVFHGALSGIVSQAATSANATLVGEATLDYFGWSVALGDVNGDGFADIAVGATGFNSGSLQGRAYVFHGKQSGIASGSAGAADTLITGEATNNEFGASVSYGDINADGFADLVVGAVRFTNSYQGRAYIFHGGSSGINSQGAASANTILTGQAGNDRFGFSVALGDINGDSFTEVIIGATSYSSGGNQGCVYIFSGSSAGIASQNASSAISILTGEATSYFGSSVSAVSPSLRPSIPNLDGPSPVRRSNGIHASVEAIAILPNSRRDEEFA